MIDVGRIAIPFNHDFCSGSPEENRGYVDLQLCQWNGAKLESGSIEYLEDGTVEVSDLRHPYESLPSSNSTLSFKIYKGGENYWPFIEIKASPAKLLQGHNVFGSTDVEKCLNHGMVDHIPKPFDVIQLKEKIYKVITQKDDISFVDKSLETITKPNDLVLNYNAAIKRMIGRDDLYKDFLNGFIKQRTNCIETIEELINKDKLEEATTEIHSLKGFVNTMGAENFGSKLEKYEVILKENKTLNKDELDDIKLDFEKVVSEVKIWLKRN